jgi:hypothetical protein
MNCTAGLTRADAGPGDSWTAFRCPPDPQRSRRRYRRTRRPPGLPLRRGRLPLLRGPLRGRTAHPPPAADSALLRPGDPRQGDGHILAGALPPLGLLPQRGAST